MSTITLQRDGDVAIASVSNPPLNLVVPAMVDDLEEIATELERRPPRALLLRAEGDNFCAGADVGEMFQGRSARDAQQMLGRFQRLLARYDALPFPTLAAVQGMCLAAGLELVLACDMAWAGESAKLGLVEAVIGAVPFGGGAQRLVERAGAARAREIVMTASIYEAAQLERWNVINRVVPDADLDGKTWRFAQRLAAGPTRAHAVTKRLIRTCLDQGTQAADRLGAEIAPALFETEDMRNGIVSLLERGPGNATFIGR
jgi:enoyl-CoA hydratase/carnithine racemase